MKCEKCKKEFEEKFLHEHHIIPKKWGGFDIDGRIILCSKHHKEIHNLLDILYNKNSEKNEIRKFTEKWELAETKKMPLCPVCKSPDERLHVLMMRKNDLILHCSGCGYEEKNTDLFQQELKKEVEHGDTNT